MSNALEPMLNKQKGTLQRCKSKKGYRVALCVKKRLNRNFDASLKKPLTRGEEAKIKKALTNKLWDLLKKVVRFLYRNPDGFYTCYTCGKKITKKSDAHTSHFIAKSICKAQMKYEIRNLRITCHRCNIHLGGNGSYFAKKLREDHGQEYLDMLYDLNKKETGEDEITIFTRQYENLKKFAETQGII